MEPISISTLALIAGFMVAPTPTRLREWQVKAYEPPAPKIAAATDWLINPNVITAPSQDMAATFANQMPVLDRMGAIALEMELYGSLDAGWDGPDSQVPSQENIQDALTLLAKLPAGLPLPKPMLSSTGSIGLYWDTQKVFADIALEGNGRFSLFTRLKSGDRTETFADDVKVGGIETGWFAQNLAVLFDA